MRYRLKVVPAVLLLISVAVGAGLALEARAKSEAALPGADGKALYGYIEKSYRSWSLWPGMGKFHVGTEPHGILLTTYVNDVALIGIKEKKALRDRAIIVKENYSPDKKLMALTVMYKVKGYSPEAGDWFWAKYSPDGAVLAEGKVKGCIACHSRVRDKDYLFTGSHG